MAAGIDDSAPLTTARTLRPTLGWSFMTAAMRSKTAALASDAMHEGVIDQQTLASVHATSSGWNSGSLSMSTSASRAAGPIVSLSLSSCASAAASAPALVGSESAASNISILSHIAACSRLAREAPTLLDPRMTAWSQPSTSSIRAESLGGASGIGGATSGGADTGACKGADGGALISPAPLPSDLTGRTASGILATVSGSTALLSGTGAGCARIITGAIERGLGGGLTVGKKPISSDGSGCVARAG
mmetsp:Transcript_35072/g.112968  ORF Transcript_35072/g.112968 Transcript_35072/m.112968 type:complete len:247 (+) Transcript_35072:761-1501(+)